MLKCQKKEFDAEISAEENIVSESIPSLRFIHNIVKNDKS